MKDMIKRIASDPLGLMGLVLVALTVISALFAGLIAPYDPVQLNITIAGMGYYYLTNRFTGSLLYERDLMSEQALSDRIEHNVETILRLVRA